MLEKFARKFSWNVIDEEEKLYDVVTWYQRQNVKTSFKTSPTVGFNVQSVKCKRLKMVIWEIGNEGYMR